MKHQFGVAGSCHRPILLQSVNGQRVQEVRPAGLKVLGWQGFDTNPTHSFSEDPLPREHFEKDHARGLLRTQCAVKVRGLRDWPFDLGHRGPVNGGSQECTG